MSIFAQIETLAHEQQYLWQEARHKRLSVAKRQRMTSIKTELASLWHLHRCELAMAGRREWRREDKTRGRSFNEPYSAQNAIDHISVVDFVSLWQSERKRIESREHSRFDQKWQAERKRLNQIVKLEMEAETAEERRITQVVSAVLRGAPIATKSFNPHEASLRQLREHRQHTSRMSAFAATL